MPNKAKIYGEVLREVLEKTPEAKQKAVILRFKSLLKKRGDMRLLSRSLQEFKQAWETRKGKKGKAVFAKEPTKKERDAVEQLFKKYGFTYEEEIDSSLIGGTELFLGNELLIDNSIRGKLRTLWQKNISTKF